MTIGSSRLAYRARWVFPPGSEPLENATVVVHRDEGTVDRIVTEKVPGAIDLGNSAIIPGLVNAHCHLEFSHLATPIAPPNPFTQWIRNLVSARLQSEPKMTERIARGIEEVTRSGTTMVGEIATADESYARLKKSGLGGVVFRELIGLTDDRVAQQNALLQKIAPSPDGAPLIEALSPHAPYSVREDLLDDIITTAQSRDLPISMHVAEQPAERNLLAGEGGLFRGFLDELGFYFQHHWISQRTILDLLKHLSHAPRALIVHGNDLNEDEIDFLATQDHMSVVYCPRTHFYFGHPPHPWQELLARDVTVALGTDGRSSNPDLELWREVKFLAMHFPDVDHATLLRMATVDGAKALGFPQSGLAEGEPLRATVLENLPDRASSPWRLLLSDRVRPKPFPALAD